MLATLGTFHRRPEQPITSGQRNLSMYIMVISIYWEMMCLLVHTYLYKTAFAGGAVLDGELAAELRRVLPPTALLHRFFDAVIQRLTLQRHQYSRRGLFPQRIHTYCVGYLIDS